MPTSTRISWLLILAFFLLTPSLLLAIDMDTYPPDQPRVVYPENGATGIDRNTDLNWLASDSNGDDLTYSLYFGTSSSPACVASGWSGEYYDLYDIVAGPLAANTEYFWKIVAHDASDSTSSPVWSFTTAKALGSADINLQEVVVDGSLSSPMSATAADMDGDGDLDVVGVARFGSEVDWWENTDGTGTSWTKHTISSSYSYPYDVCATDIDGDGDMDAVTVSSTSEALSWWENTDGSGTSWTEVEIDASHIGGRAVFPADINQDGYIDIVCSGYSADVIAWYENTNGTGTIWVKDTVATALNGAYGVYAKDLDDDGDLDIVGTGYLEKELAWWENTDGAGTSWTKTSLISGSNSVTAVDVFDLDGTGTEDVISSWYSDLNWMQNGTPWTENTISTTPTTTNAVHATDLDGDGYVDVLAAYTSGEMIWWQNDDGSAQNWTNNTLVEGFESGDDVTTADLNGDGFPDIIGAAGSDGKISVWLTSPNEAPDAATVSYPTDAGTGVSAALTFQWNSSDPNGDDLTYTLYVGTSNPPTTAVASDIADTSYSTVLTPVQTYYWKIVSFDAWGGSTESDVWSFTTATNSAPDQPYYISPANGATGVSRTTDLNYLVKDEDGQDLTWDLYFDTNPIPTTLVANDYSGEYFDLYDALSGPMDFNETYYWKLVVSDGITTTTSPVYSFTTADTLGSKTIRYDKNSIVTGYTGAIGVNAVDLDADGDVDVIGTANMSDNISWWENDGGSEPSWTQHTIASSANGACDAVAADVDGDGDLDVFGALRDSDDLAWWENTDGSATSWTAHEINTGFDGPVDVSPCDVDGDGDIDLYSIARYGGELSWFENETGDGTNWSEHLIGTGLNGPQSVGAADMNGDGYMDVIATATNYDKILWWKNTDGSGTTWTEYEVATAFFSAQVAYPADIDNDGDLDVVGSSNSNNEIAWFENNDGSATNWTKHSIDAAIEAPFAVYANDFNGDGEMDVLASAYGADKIILYKNSNGSGTNWSVDSVDVSYDAPIRFDAGDFNGDDQLDILCSGFSEDEIAWWKVDLNQPPLWTTPVSPEDEISDVSISPTLVWNSAVDPEGDAVYYKLYGEHDSTPAVVLVDSTTDTSFAVSGLSFETAYFWRVVVFDSYGDSVECETWSFLTKANSAPEQPYYIFPADGAGFASRTQRIYWSCKDEDGQSLSYTLFAGYNTGLLAEVIADWDGNSFSISEYSGTALLPDTTVYWQLEIDDGVSTTTTSVYSFSTVDSLPSDGNRRPIYSTIDETRPEAMNNATVDIDGDGDIDIVDVTYTSSGDVSWYENGYPAVTWTKHTIGSGKTNLFQVESADMDGDGDPDVITIQETTPGVLSWWENDVNGSGTWTEHIIADTLAESYSIAIEDMNLDGSFDIGIAANPGCLILTNDDGLGTSWTMNTVESTDSYMGLAISDMDRDGIPDIITSGSGGVALWTTIISPNGLSWNFEAIAGGLPPCLTMPVFDLNLDGQNEVLLPTFAGFTFLMSYESNGESSIWTPTILSDSSGMVFGAEAVDLDGDSDLDLLFSSSDIGEIFCMENTGGGFVQRTLLDGLASPNGVSVANLDNSGEVDIVFSVGGNAGLLGQMTIAINNPPDTPVSPSPSANATEVPPDHLTLSWPASEDADSDTVRYKALFGVTSPPTAILDDSMVDTFFTLEGDLGYNNTFFWQVLAYDEYGDTSASEIWTFDTEVNTPQSAASNPVPATGGVDASINPTLSWDASIDDEGHDLFYQVYFDTQSPPSVMVEDSTTDASFAVSDLDYESLHYWKVITISETGDTVDSEIWSFTTEVNDPPTMASNPIPSDGATDVEIGATVSWSPSTDEEGHSFYYKVLGGEVSPPAIVMADSLSDTCIADLMMEFSTTYFWQVITYGEMGDSAVGDIWSFTTVDNTPPTAPSNPDPADGGLDIALLPELSWDASVDSDGPSVYYRVYAGTANPPTVMVEDSTGSTSFTTESLEYETTYFWQVTAIDSIGDSTQSAVWSFTTMDNMDPYTPNTPSPADLATSVSRLEDLSWLASDYEGDSLKYDVYFGTSGSPELVLADWRGEYFDPFSNLAGPMAPNTTYFWKVVAKDANGSTEGPLWSFTTGSSIDLASGTMRIDPTTITDDTANKPNLVPADVDGDGDLDIVTVDMDGSKVVWLENVDGSGETWSQNVIDNDFGYASFMLASDIDGDGDIDIFAGGYTTLGELSWYENTDGTGDSWTKTTISETFNYFVDLELADLDLDGDLDLVGASNNIGLYWWRCDVDAGSGTISGWTEFTVCDTTVYHGLSVADIDGDADLDFFAISQQTDKVYWVENTLGTGASWTSHTLGNSIYDPYSISAVDFDDDGDIDAISDCSYFDRFDFWENTSGDGASFSRDTLSIDEVENPQNVKPVDIDGDGNFDFAGTANGEFAFWTNDNGDESRWTKHLLSDQIEHPSKVYFGDVDGDGLQDIIGLNGEVVWWKIGLNQAPALSAFAPEDAGTGVALDSTLAWSGSDPEDDLLTYRVYLDTVTPPITLVSEQVTDSTFAPSSLEFSTTYYWKVVATDVYGDSVVSEIFSFTTRDNQPPSSFAYLEPGDGYEETENYQVEVSWQKSTDSDAGQSISYRLDWSLDEEFGSYYFVDLFDTTYTIHELVSPSSEDGAVSRLAVARKLVKKNHRLQTLDSFSDGSSSSRRGKVVNSGRRLTGSGKLASNDFSTSGSFKTDVSGGTVLNGQAGPSGSLPDDSTIYYRVLAFDSYGDSTWASDTSTPQSFSLNVPDAPEAFTLLSPIVDAVVKVDSSKLVWYQTTDADPYDTPTYEVWVDTLADMSTKWNASSLEDTTCTLYDLSDDTDYYWTVYATDSNTDGMWAADTLHFSVAIPNAPNAFCMIAPTVETVLAADSVTLRWEAGGDPDPGDTLLYTIEMALLSDFSECVDSTIADTSITLTGLIDDTTFYWRVYATDKTGQVTECSDYEAGWSFATFIPDSPNDFDLVAPEDGFALGSELNFPLIFRWADTGDPDPGDTLRYQLMISSSETFSDTVVFEEGIEVDSFALDTLVAGVYWWQVVAEDEYGLHTLSTEAWRLDVVLGVDDLFANLPTEYSISRLYPNPFNPSLNIVVGLPQVADLTVQIFNIMGRQVATIQRGVEPQGYHTYVFNGSHLASGVYFVRAHVPSHLEQVQKVILMK